MKRLRFLGWLIGVMPAIVAWELSAQEVANRPTVVRLSEFQPKADGKTDDSESFIRCFAAAMLHPEASIVIEPKIYYLSGERTISIGSRLTVDATGATFLLPSSLPDRARIVVFGGKNITDFSWTGGEFVGNGFDPTRRDNLWEPNVSVRIFAITTSVGGSTQRIHFKRVRSKRVSGAIVTVAGMLAAGSASDVTVYASDILLEGCIFEKSGQFMWDYGYLWQAVMWPQLATDLDSLFAGKYFPQRLVKDNVRFEAGGTRVIFDNRDNVVQKSITADTQYLVTFSADKLPEGVVTGKAYCVIDSQPTYIEISETVGGVPLQFVGGGDAPARMVYDLNASYWQLFVPSGSGGGKGAFDLVGCKNVVVTSCEISSFGDAMHIQRSKNVILQNNKISGARMGAIFLAEYCKNTIIVGNDVDGANGSRILSVEKAAENVAIIGNSFRNGGRGSWINQPKNIYFGGNEFSLNTKKGQPGIGRRSYATGGYDRFPEIYFTVYDTSWAYGSAVIQANTIETGPASHQAITFPKGGSDLLVVGNRFFGARNDVGVEAGSKNVLVDHNQRD